MDDGPVQQRVRVSCDRCGSHQDAAFNRVRMWKVCGTCSQGANMTLVLPSAGERAHGITLPALVSEARR